MIYLQPSVDLNGLDSLHQSLVHIGPMSVVKPQGEKPVTKAGEINSESRQKPHV